MNEAQGNTRQEWVETTIGRIGEVVTGRTPSTKNQAFYGGEFKLISPVDLGTRKYVTTSHKRLTETGFRQGRPLPPESVLVSCIGTIGKLGILGDEVSTTNQQINAIICSDSFDPHFVYYSLMHNRKRLTTAASMTTMPILNKTYLQLLRLLIPPLDEQWRIAAVLSLVQRAIEQQERLIALTTELKRALMHKLFTEGLRGEPQKETEIGPIPESWEVVPLEQIATIERGKFSHRPRNDPRFYGGSTPFVQTGDVTESEGRIRQYSQSLNELGLSVSKVFPAGTILITIAANIGYSGILEFDSACPDSLIGLTPTSATSPEYLQYYLSTQQPRMDYLAPRGTQKNINIQFLKPWPVGLPGRQEQKEIAETLALVDRRGELAKNTHAALTDLFRTLLHQLMTAQIRVHALDTSILVSAEETTNAG